jgi:S1-C subfamily serine protease
VKLRHRILPRTVIGISFMLTSLGVGAAFSGAAFYAYYDNRLAQNEQAVALFVDGFDQQFSDAAKALDDLRIEAVEDIRTELAPLGDSVTDSRGVVGLPPTAGGSVWLLETMDEAGEPVAGSAFAVAPHENGTVFLTSYALVMASTTAPSPVIELVKGTERLPAQLWSWDVERDLAVLVVAADVPNLPLADEPQQAAAVGQRVFAMAGVGGQGSTAAPGVLLDRSERGLQHTAPVGFLYRGGPLLSADGRVLGVASLNYRPYGFDPGAVAQAPGVADLCQAVLTCADLTGGPDLAAAEAQAPPAGSAEVDEIDPDAEG